MMCECCKKDTHGRAIKLSLDYSDYYSRCNIPDLRKIFENKKVTLEVYLCHDCASGVIESILPEGIEFPAPFICGGVDYNASPLDLWLDKHTEVVEK